MENNNVNNNTLIDTNYTKMKREEKRRDKVTYSPSSFAAQPMDFSLLFFWLLRSLRNSFNKFDHHFVSSSLGFVDHQFLCHFALILIILIQIDFLGGVTRK